MNQDYQKKFFAEFLKRDDDFKNIFLKKFYQHFFQSQKDQENLFLDFFFKI